MRLRVEHQDGLEVEVERLILSPGLDRELAPLRMTPHASFTVHVSDETKKPVAGVRIQARIMESRTTVGPSFTKTGVTDEKGNAIFLHVPPGKLTLVVEQPGGTSRKMNHVDLKPHVHPTYQVSLKIRTCDLRGTVSTSKPVSGPVKLLLYRKLADGEYERLAATEVKAPGNYSFPNLSPGIYKVEGVVLSLGRSWRGQREFDLAVGNAPIHLIIRLDP